MSSAQNMNFMRLSCQQLVVDMEELRALVSTNVERKDAEGRGDERAGPSKDSLRDVDRLADDVHSLIADLRAVRDDEVERARATREALCTAVSRAVREAVASEMRKAVRDGAAHQNKKRKMSTPTEAHSPPVTASDVGDVEATASDVGNENI